MIKLFIFRGLIPVFQLNYVAFGQNSRDLCSKGQNMQYYKGKALEKEGIPEPAVEIRQVSYSRRLLRILAFPGVIVYWIVQDLVYKSLDDFE